ncbi:MAG: CinA family protein [Opitutaceae bacterium]
MMRIAENGPRTLNALKQLMLKKPRLTLAVAESLTCGRVQARVGEISGASDFFLGGITAYTLDAKTRHLGVDRRAARRVNSVSSAIAVQMARGVCDLFGSDLGIATTGYAEPSPQNGVAGAYAWWALVHRRRGKFVAVQSGRVECPGESRVDVQMRVADAVLAELVAYLDESRR